MGGPIWLAELNDLAFVKKLSDIVDSPENKLELASEKKIKGLLHGILNVHIICFFNYEFFYFFLQIIKFIFRKKN